MIAEGNIAAQWLISYLGTQLSLPIFEDLAPDGQAAPYVIISLNRSSDLWMNGPNRAWAEEIWSINVVTEGPGATQIRQLSNQLENALYGQVHVAVGSPNTGTIVSCRRESELRGSPTVIKETQQVFRSRGGLYKIISQAA
jgi:hypothetical protein